MYVCIFSATFVHADFRRSGDSASVYFRSRIRVKTIIVQVILQVSAYVLNLNKRRKSVIKNQYKHLNIIMHILFFVNTIIYRITTLN